MIQAEPDVVPRTPGREETHVWTAILFPLLVILICVVGFNASAVRAESAPPPPVRDADQQYAFAEHRLKNGQYAKAVDEFQRFIFFFPDDSRVEQAMFEIGRAYFADRIYRDAIAAFQCVIRTYPASDAALQSQLWIGRSHAGLGEFGEGIALLKKTAETSGRQDIRDEAYYEIAWANLEIAAGAYERDVFAGAVNEAVLSFERIGGEDQQTRLAVDRTVAALRDDKQDDYKSPRVAGSLALIPGAGHLYCGRYQDALIAFALNAGLVLASVEAFQNDLPVMGTLAGAVGLGFYTGNIYSAVSSAYKNNKSRNRRFIDGLKNNAAIRLSVDPELKRHSLNLDVEF